MLLFWRAQTCHGLESVPVGDTVHKQKAGARPNVLGTHDAVFLLPGRVQDVENKGLVVEGYLFAVAVFDGGVIVPDEVVLCELDREG